MIRATELVKAYGSRRAVDGVSFEVQAGETFGLLGPNGAGKSTTINMLVGALKPDSGTVAIAGQNDPTRAAARQLIGVAPQALALYEDLTARENLRFFGSLYKLSGKALADRVTIALEFVGLADRADSAAKTFSGGMKRRLNLAVALVHDPQVILLDEPTVGVDPQSRNHLFDNVEKLQQQGRTILYTTHYMEEAARLCNRVAIVDHGKLLALDTVENLIASHGGTSVVEIEFSPGEEPIVDDASNPLPANASLDGQTLRIDTTEPDREVSRLVNEGRKFAAIRVRRPDLESVFLNLTGRRLRD